MSVVPRQAFYAGPSGDPASPYELQFQVEMAAMQQNGQLETDIRELLPLQFNEGNKEQIELTVSRGGTNSGDVVRFQDDAANTAEYTKRTERYSDYYITEEMHKYVNEQTRVEQLSDLFARFIRKDTQFIMKRYLTSLMGNAKAHIKDNFPKNDTVPAEAAYKLVSRADDGWQDIVQSVGAGGTANPDTIESLFKNKDIDSYEELFNRITGAVAPSHCASFSPGVGNVAICDSWFYQPYDSAYRLRNASSNPQLDATIYGPAVATLQAEPGAPSRPIKILGGNVWNFAVYKDRDNESMYSSLIDFLTPESGQDGYSIFPILIAGMAGAWYLGYIPRDPFMVEERSPMQKHTLFASMHGSTAAIRQKTRAQGAFWGRVKNTTIVASMNLMNTVTPNMDEDQKRKMYKDAYAAPGSASIFGSETAKERLSRDEKKAQETTDAQQKLEDKAGKAVDRESAAVAEEASSSRRR